MSKTLSLLQKLSKVRGYHVAYASFFDSVQDAILFEHLLAASQNSTDDIKINEAEALELLGLKRDAFRAARERLALRGVVTYTVKRAGPRTTTSYKVNQELFARQFAEWVDDDNEVSVEKQEPPPPAEDVLAEAVALIGQVIDSGQGGTTVSTLPAGVQTSAPKKKKASSNAHLLPIAYAMIEVTGSDAGVHMGPAMKAAGAIFKSTTAMPTADLIRQKYGGNPSAWWWTNDWRGKKGDRPTFWSIQESWGKWLSDGSQSSAQDSPGVDDEDIFRYGMPGL